MLQGGKVELSVKKMAKSNHNKSGKKHNRALMFQDRSDLGVPMDLFHQSRHVPRQLPETDVFVEEYYLFPLDHPQTEQLETMHLAPRADPPIQYSVLDDKMFDQLFANISAKARKTRRSKPQQNKTPSRRSKKHSRRA